MRKSAAYFSIIALVCFVLSGCGKKEKTPEELAKENMQNMEKMAQGMQQTGRQAQKSLYGDHKPVPPISFKVLMGYLPATIPGMKEGKPKGESTSMGDWSFSLANNHYSNDGGSQTINVEISDFAYISMLYAPYQFLMNSDFKHESSEGYERTTKISGFPAMEKWTESSKEHEVTILTGERFLVHVSCRGMSDGSATKVAEGINLSKLAGEK